MECSWINLPACLLEALGDFILSIINAPITPFLEVIKQLLTQPANIQAFGALWAVIIYIISTFYGLFIIFAGFNLIISGYNAEKRERAKEWLQNTLLMIFFVQASFFIYALISELASGVTAGVVSIIDPNFFLFTLDNLVNVYLEIAFGIFYVSILFTTVIVFSINYLLASIGVLFFPFGLFFYFIPPLRDIGKFVISNLVFVLFLPFFASLIFLGGAELIKVGGFSMVKIVLTLGAFALVNVLMVLLAVLAVFRAVMGVMRSDVARGVMFLKGHFLMGSAMQKSAPEQGREYWGRVRKDYYGRPR
ncbi:Uncharacterised protein [uncultured archaeon]|nr:Uncharacterised protein [uncultured archaeon]